MIFYITLLLILSIAPMIWLNYVFTKNDKILVNMPFTGLEFGKIILNELGLNDVKIEKSLSIEKNRTKDLGGKSNTVECSNTILSNL